MCRYILKKDLPTFKAGDRFYLGADRGLYLEPKDGQFKNAIKAYDHQTL